MRVNLISRNNGVGLTQDIQLLTELLVEDGHEVNYSEYGEPVQEVSPKHDLNIFVELVHAAHFKQARLNAIIPNPEWYDLRWRQFLPRFNSILCKTKSAVQSFQVLSRKCEYISFTSKDRYDSSMKKDEDCYLHIAGKSVQKGTDMVYQTWSENPHFPHLTILQHPGKAKERESLKNVTLIHEYVDDKKLIELQNNCGVHICPSEAEGFGHYLMEGLSARALVVTTDGPPMNELVDQDRGILCGWKTKARQRFATNYYVTTKDLAAAVERVMMMDQCERDRLRDNARDFFLSNDKTFRKAFKDAVRRMNYEKHRVNPMLASRRLSQRHPRAY